MGQVQFVVFEKIYKCLCIQNCTRKIMLLCVIIHYEKIGDSYAEARRAHQLQKFFTQILQLSLCVRSKEPRTIKTMIHICYLPAGRSVW